MKTVQVSVKAWVGDWVRVPALDDRYTSQITSVQFGSANIMYHIVWYHEGKRESGWVTEHEFDLVLDVA